MSLVNLRGIKKTLFFFSNMQSNLSKSFCGWLLAHLFDKFDNKNLKSQSNKKLILDLYRIANDKNYSKCNNVYIIARLEIYKIIEQYTHIHGGFSTYSKNTPTFPTHFNYWIMKMLKIYSITHAL
jgi:hypothetical protein